MAPKPQPLDVGKGAVVMVYGLPGAGKTRLLGTGPRTLIIRPPDDHTDSIEEPNDCTELVLTSWAEMFETYGWLHQGAYKEFDWVWLDSISLMQDRLLDDVMTDMLKRREDRAIEKGGMKVPEFGPDKGEYKLNFERIAQWIRYMTAMSKEGKFNFGITAHPFETENPITNEMEWAPWIQGKNMSSKVGGYMNVIAYLLENRGDKGVQRILMTDAKGFVGKDQLFCFPTMKSGRHGILDPTMPKLIKAIKQARKSGRQPQRSAAPTRRRKLHRIK